MNTALTIERLYDLRLGAMADRACRRGRTALYKRVARLVFELKVARADGSYLKVIEKIAKTDLLALDGWGLAALDAQEANDLMDVIDDRAGRSSTIVTSQLPSLSGTASSLTPPWLTRSSTGSFTAPSESS